MCVRLVETAADNRGGGSGVAAGFVGLALGGAAAHDRGGEAGITAGCAGVCRR